MTKPVKIVSKQTTTTTEAKEVYLTPEITQSIRDSVDRHCKVYVKQYLEGELDTLITSKIEQYLSPTPKIVILKEVSENEARKMIIQYLTEHEEADTGELVEKLGVDIDIVQKVIRDLKSEGSVVGVNAST